MTDLLPISLPAWLTPQLLVSALVIVIVLHVALGAAAYGIWLERKLSAWVQDRVGPNRVGPFGLLQPIADGLKLITKEEFRPRGVDVALFSIAPFLSVIPAMVGIAAIPWAGGLDLSAFGLEGVVRLQGAISIWGLSSCSPRHRLACTASLWGMGFQQQVLLLWWLACGGPDDFVRNPHGYLSSVCGVGRRHVAYG